MNQSRSIGFVGGGRVARILLEGWKTAGELPGRICVVEPGEASWMALRKECPEARLGRLEDMVDCDVILLAVHPPVLVEVIKQLSTRIGPATTVVSLAPKVTVDDLAEALGTNRIVRMIPNAPSTVGAGYNPVVFGAGIESDAKQELVGLFAPWGDQPEVPEEDLEIYAIITAMGPTYFWYQVQALRDLAVSFGLVEQTANLAVQKMLEGAVDCLLKRGPEAMDLIPVKPLAELEPVVEDAYESKLREMFARLQPARAQLV